MVFEQKFEIGPDLMFLINFKNMTLRGIAGTNWTMALEFMQKGQVRTRDLVTHEFDLNNIKEAFEKQLDSEESIKVIIKP